ncbi:MAG TPA: hypothetical protein VHG10_10180, partial [Glycomyces sp.]|nr:hypothetical protein [Glycomyces sp.]
MLRIEEAAQIGATVLPARGYGIAYGSQATGFGSPTSDLDLLYVVGVDVAESTKQRLADSVIDLHRRHGLVIDDEVAHEVKLTVTATEMSAALALAPFTGSDGQSLRVPVVVPTSGYLNSPEFKHRLVLGALTGPHLFLCGDLTRYRRDFDAAIRAVVVLTSAMLAHKPTTTGDDVRSALLTHPSGATGKDYLGYQHGPAFER